LRLRKGQDRKVKVKAEVEHRKADAGIGVNYPLTLTQGLNLWI
jgi:hypothetical protein